MKPKYTFKIIQWGKHRSVVLIKGQKSYQLIENQHLINIEENIKSL